MGSVTFSIPIDLAATLIEAEGLRYGVETGTYLGHSALMLAELLDEVWSVELLPEILEQVPGPALYWLDGHGGTFGGNDVPAHVKECPVLDELEAIAAHPHAARSVVLIDDARAFLGPLLHHRPDWPSFGEVADALGRDRYVTILDDVIIGVPADLRPVVDAWWTGKLLERDGLDAHPYLITKLMDPVWVEEFKAAFDATA